MDSKELKALQHLHRLMLELEKDSRDQGFESHKIQKLQDALGVFSSHERLELRKIAEIAKHLTPTMTMKHYVSWIVPVERLLQKELRDDDFLIYSTDAVSTGPRAAGTDKLPLVFILHNLRSAFNVGSIFRTAECFGVSKIYLCGYTPLPTQAKLTKTAMGTERLVEWEEAPSVSTLLRSLKEKNYQILGLETTSHALPLDQEFASQPAAFVLGNERFGLDPEILELCTEVREIPLRGQKNSLNVGVAAAIAAYEFARQWRGATWV